jgi:hypothetical protein
MSLDKKTCYLAGICRGMEDKSGTDIYVRKLFTHTTTSSAGSGFIYLGIHFIQVDKIENKKRR